MAVSGADSDRMSSQILGDLPHGGRVSLDLAVVANCEDPSPATISPSDSIEVGVSSGESAITWLLKVPMDVVGWRVATISLAAITQLRVHVRGDNKFPGSMWVVDNVEVQAYEVTGMYKWLRKAVSNSATQSTLRNCLWQRTTAAPTPQCTAAVGECYLLPLGSTAQEVWTA